MGCNHKHFYLVHTAPLKRGDSFLGPCFSGGPCQPSGLSKYHHTSAWSDSSHLPWLCLSHPLPARARTPWLFHSNLPPFLHVSAAKKDKRPPRLRSSIHDDRCQWLTPTPCWSFTILNINVFFCWFTELQSYCLYHQCGSPRNRWGEANRACVAKPACQSPLRHREASSAQKPSSQRRQGNGGAAGHLVLVVTGQSPHPRNRVWPYLEIGSLRM